MFCGYPQLRQSPQQRSQSCHPRGTAAGARSTSGCTSGLSLRVTLRIDGSVQACSACLHLAPENAINRGEKRGTGQEFGSDCLSNCKAMTWIEYGGQEGHRISSDSSWSSLDEESPRSDGNNLTDGASSPCDQQTSCSPPECHIKDASRLDAAILCRASNL